MQIVIDIPEDVYTRLFDNGIQDNEIAIDDVCEMARASRLGTPLPKGHGRLIDADKIINSYLEGNWNMHKILNDAPTIVEADRSEEE